MIFLLRSLCRLITSKWHKNARDKQHQLRVNGTRRERRAAVTRQLVNVVLASRTCLKALRLAQLRRRSLSLVHRSRDDFSNHAGNVSQVSSSTRAALSPPPLTSYASVSAVFRERPKIKLLLSLLPPSGEPRFAAVVARRGAIRGSFLASNLPTATCNAGEFWAHSHPHLALRQRQAVKTDCLSRFAVMPRVRPVTNCKSLPSRLIAIGCFQTLPWRSRLTGAQLHFIEFNFSFNSTSAVVRLLASLEVAAARSSPEVLTAT